MRSPQYQPGRQRRHGITSQDQPEYDAPDWAWEFLRRNAGYVADWRRSVPQRLPCVTLNDGTRLLRLPRRFPQAEKWGLAAFADPALCAEQAPVFWHASAFKRVVRLRANVPNERAAQTYRLSDFRVERRAIIDVDQTPFVLMKGRGVHVALKVEGLSVLSRPFRPVFELHGLDDLAVQNELFKRLQRFREQPRAAPHAAQFTSDERLRHALVALDESLNGKTYRQIAITIFGVKMVADEWLGASQFLKDRTRRLVAKGKELMDGGYRDLLN
ncbi:DUF2285 domain-containing protein [Bradyrhizobium sp. WSM 1704]|uniref:DUF2285 domain-containing protein n=1 Tax=Bradyrhizobium semiaridum TaxID=2821404 RepID=UPI001CE2F9E3|nr:DUF2285 domain-containing protein [Bradyrhizobium semiaridum]MCA6121275.1 DUF2285 domain-containing protein [Bradyrhizobium semiaridum]